MLPFARGSRLTVRIESVAYRGAGIARSGGCVLFVPGACPDELVEVRVTNVKPRYAEAEITELLEPSPARRAPDCRVPAPFGRRGFVRAPGCVYDHLDYAEEVAVKNGQLLDFLVRGAKSPNAAGLLRQPVPAPRPLHYRNKTVLHAVETRGGVLLGYIGDDNRSVVDIPQCPLSVPEINDALAAFRASPAFRKLRTGDSVTFRWTPNDGAVHWVNRPLPTQRPLTEHCSFGSVEVPADGFFQVNPWTGAKLVDAVVNAARATNADALVDLYCGVGVFAFAALAAGIPRAVGVESGWNAVDSARRNAAALGLGDAKFLCGAVADGIADALALASDKGGRVCAVVDPPRDGLEPAALRALCDRRDVDTLVYVSCAPDTLARDLRALLASGYALSSAQLFDMFPRTLHFESVCVLSGPSKPALDSSGEIQ